MSGFTTQTTVPLRYSGYGWRIHTVLIDDHVWIFHSNNETRELHKFNTGTFQVEVVDCVFPEGFDKMPLKVTSDQHYIYVVLRPRLPIDLRFFQREASIFKFHTYTLQWEFVTNHDFSRIPLLGPIVDNQFHFLKFVDNQQRVLMKMDLTTKVVEQTPFQDSNNGLRKLLVNDGQVYVIHDGLENGPSHVSQLRNGQLEVLNTYYWNNIEGKTLERHNNSVENGYALTVRRGNGPITTSDTRTLYLDEFDSTTMRWNRTTLPNFFRREISCVSNLTTKGDKIFAVFMERSRNTTFSIRMYETSPNLSTICMLDLVDKMNDATETEPVIEGLPIPLRSKMENMKWKIAFNKIRLEKRQRRRVVREIRRMERQGLVDHRMQRKLRSEFDNNFSDSNDSDITDFDVEPHESTDDEDNMDVFLPGRLRRIDERHMEIL